MKLLEDVESVLGVALPSRQGAHESNCWYSDSHHSSLKPRRSQLSLVTTSQPESTGGAVAGAVRLAS